MAEGLALFDLTVKRALVTGSSQGIGHALAQALPRPTGPATACRSTPSHRAIRHALERGAGGQPRVHRLVREAYPRRCWGQLPELVGACIFLASAASSFVSGPVLYVDGGITASL